MLEENEEAIELETLVEKSQISQHFHAVSRGHEKGSQRPISNTIDKKVSQVLNSSFAVKSARTVQYNTNDFQTVTIVL